MIPVRFPCCRPRWLPGLGSPHALHSRWRLSQQKPDGLTKPFRNVGPQALPLSKMRTEKDSELKRQQGEQPEGMSHWVEGDGGSEHPGSPAALRCSGRSPHTPSLSRRRRVLPNCTGSKGGATKGSPLAFYSISFLKLLGKTGGRRDRKKKKGTWALMQLKNSWRLGGHMTLVTRWGLFSRLLETKNFREEITWKLALYIWLNVNVAKY